MQQQVVESPEDFPSLSKSERRRYPRTVSHTTCLIRTKDGAADYMVGNLSVCGALLTDGPLLPIGTKVWVVLQIPLYPDIEVWARVRRHGRGDDGMPFLGVEFLHTTDTTEDHIQSALLSELERSHTHGQIPTDID
jgi:hypothetical protein